MKRFTPKTSSDAIEEFFVDSFPVVVGSSVNLAAGENQQLDHEQIGNIYNNAMLIDEIRFRVVTDDVLGFAPSTSDVNGTYYNFGGSVSVRFTLGRYALSRIPIPIAAFAPPIEGPTVGLQPVAGWAENRIQAGDPSPFIPRAVISHYAWKLPRPLLVPAGMVLDAIISRANDGLYNPGGEAASNRITVDVAYAGRVARGEVPGGLLIPVPYVGAYLHEFTTPTEVFSQQQDLYNPFQTTLHVHRLVGRLQTNYHDVVDDSWQRALALDQRVDSGPGGDSPTYFPDVRLRTFDEIGITKDFLPGVAVFEGFHRALNLNVDLDPLHGIEATINARTGLPNAGTGGTNTVIVTMIGWREESL